MKQRNGAVIWNALRSLALGARPLWKPLAVAAAALLALTIYLLAFSLYLR